MLRDAKKTAASLCEWIHTYMAAAGETTKVVIGLSGGKDSSVTAALCVAALGCERVIGVLMPNGVQKDIEDAKQIARHLGIRTVTVNIAEAVNGLLHAVATAEGCDVLSNGISDDSKINLPARIRMATLYAVAQSLPGGARVVNTCNASEDYVGYSTKYGDAAGDFSPLQQLLVHEVRQLGEVLGVPHDLVYKCPSDGLSGLSDEDKLGFTYAELDHYILTGECESTATKERIDRLHRMNLHKLQLMPAYELQTQER